MSIDVNLRSPLVADGVVPFDAVPIAWPAELPDCPDSWSEQAEPVTVRTQVEEGTPKVRRRFTKRLVRAQVGMTMDIAQRNALDSFFHVSLDGGVLRFDFRHPWLDQVVPWRMVEAPAFSNIGPLGVAVSMVWELAN
ncbi:MAG TPA: hypothetical protein VMS92_13455 [Mycobacterium sp.]|nr:hypothetical protein [Mycobacterium sp.]